MFFLNFYRPPTYLLSTCTVLPFLLSLYKSIYLHFLCFLSIIICLSSYLFNLSNLSNPFNLSNLSELLSSSSSPSCSSSSSPPPPVSPRPCLHQLPPQLPPCQLFAKLFANFPAQCAPLDLNLGASQLSAHHWTSTWELPSSVCAAGPQPGSFPAQCAPLDLNLGPSQLSVHRWTSTWDLPSSVCTAGPQRPDRMPEDMPDRMSDRMPKDMPDKIR